MSAGTQSATGRFFGVLRNLFSRTDTNGSHNPPPTGQLLQPPVAPAPLPPRKPVKVATPEKVAAKGGEAVELPLQVVIMSMSQELKARVRTAVSDDLTISIPVDKILPQLGKGTVKISFGDVRRAVPQVFAIGMDHDHLPVMLPLAEVMSRLNPALLPRRKAQQQHAQISEDILSPFELGGRGIKVSAESPKPAPVAQPIPRRSPPVGALPLNGTRSITPESRSGNTERIVNTGNTERFSFVPVARTPPSSPPLSPARPLVPTAKPIAPVSPITPIAPEVSAPEESRPIPMSMMSAAIPRIVSDPRSPAAGADPIAPISPINPDAKPASPAPVVSSGPPLVVALSALVEAWPETLRQEILKANLAGSKIALPSGLVENGLKRGRVAFTWKQLRAWIIPTPISTPSVHDEIEVLLPLKTLAPLFMARHKSPVAQAAQPPLKEVTVDESIPNLFFGFPQPDAPVAPEVIAPRSEPVAAVTAAPAAPAQTKPVETNYYVFGDDNDTAFIDESEPKKFPVARPASGTDFMVKYATPNEIVSRASALDGVAGALIALPDGLMVANKIPEDLNGDTLAAFLPQIFAKMTQCTKELRMGELNNLNFTVGNIPWKIFRVNAVFFAAFGHAAKPMPTAELAALAGELDRKNKR
jgi:predicted regulator of Ras-like GTPase activity (Roadblock/LC7/MglB family)